MAHFTFRYNDEQIFRWHNDLKEGIGADYFFEYLWFDAPLTDENGDEYYIKVAPYSSCVPGSHGTTCSGIPGVGLDLVLPSGLCLDDFITYDPADYRELPFGGYWGDNSFLGEYDENGEMVAYTINMKFAHGIEVDLRAEVVAKGLSVVKDDHGYSYYHPVKNIGLGWWPVIPRAEVTGTLKVNGVTHSVTGPAYLDRQAGNNPDAFGGETQKWWKWGHFWAGEYTATFTDSAASENYRFSHYSPFMLWKGSELILATYDFNTWIERYALDAETGKFYPHAQSQRATDGSIQVLTQLVNGVLAEPNTTSLDKTSRYVGQVCDVNMQIKRFGDIKDTAKGKCCIEFGAGFDFIPWEKLLA